VGAENSIKSSTYQPFLLWFKVQKLVPNEALEVRYESAL
jgi:hypothetical protein